jgi:hypothetical protein
LTRQRSRKTTRWTLSISTHLLKSESEYTMLLVDFVWKYFVKKWINYASLKPENITLHDIVHFALNLLIILANAMFRTQFHFRTFVWLYSKNLWNISIFVNCFETEVHDPFRSP